MGKEFVSKENRNRRNVSSKLSPNVTIFPYSLTEQSIYFSGEQVDFMYICWGKRWLQNSISGGWGYEVSGRIAYGSIPQFHTNV